MREQSAICKVLYMCFTFSGNFSSLGPHTPVFKFKDEDVSIECPPDIVIGGGPIWDIQDQRFSFQDLFQTEEIPQETFMIVRKVGEAPVPGWFNKIHVNLWVQTMISTYLSYMIQWYKWQTYILGFHYFTVLSYANLLMISYLHGSLLQTECI